MANDASTSETVATRIEREKKEVLKFLAENPVVATACRKADVSRATYYRWLDEDPLFGQEAAKASVQGRSFRCDMAESVVFGKVAEKDFGAAKYVLEHHHPTYMPPAKTVTLHWKEQRRRQVEAQRESDRLRNVDEIKPRLDLLTEEFEQRMKDEIIASAKKKYASRELPKKLPKQSIHLPGGFIPLGERPDHFQ